jgi:hypothetical protein
MFDLVAGVRVQRGAGARWCGLAPAGGGGGRPLGKRTSGLPPGVGRRLEWRAYRSRLALAFRALSGGATAQEAGASTLMPCSALSLSSER